MFKCGRCGRTTVPRERAKRVTVKERRVQYGIGPDSGRVVQPGQPCGSYGNQIEKEIMICQQCQRA